MISIFFPGKHFNIRLIHIYVSTTDAEEAEVDQFYKDLRGLLELTKKYVLFIIRDWNAKVGSQEIPRIIGKFGLVVQNEAKQRLKES